MILWRLLSPCAFGHATDPLIVRVKGITRFECARCQADLGPVLAGQKYQARKPAKVKKRKSADVLKLASG